MHFTMPDGSSSLAQMFIDCSYNFLKCLPQIPVLSLLEEGVRGCRVGCCCPPPATVWFPWAVKRDHGQTTDLTIPRDIRGFPPRCGTRYPKNVDQSLTFGVWVPFSTHYTLNSDGICFKVNKKKSLILVLRLVALHTDDKCWWRIVCRFAGG